MEWTREDTVYIIAVVGATMIFWGAFSFGVVLLLILDSFVTGNDGGNIAVIFVTGSVLSLLGWMIYSKTGNVLKQGTDEPCT